VRRPQDRLGQRALAHEMKASIDYAMWTPQLEYIVLRLIEENPRSAWSPYVGNQIGDARREWLYALAVDHSIPVPERFESTVRKLTIPTVKPPVPKSGPLCKRHDLLIADAPCTCPPVILRGDATPEKIG